MEHSLIAVGDVFIDRSAPSQAFRIAGDLLRAGDVVFGNCEGVFSDTWERAPSSGPPVVAPSKNAEPLAAAGFDVMSIANNHIVDGGHRALLNTRRTLNDLGIETVGAGGSLSEARSPVVIDRDGTRIAFLAYSCVFPDGYEARGMVPGLAPMRTAEAAPDDTDAFVADINAVRARADIVAVSMHWGDMFRPFVLSDNERAIGRLAIDSGADIVLGHHHHMLRGIEFYAGKPIFYGLGHFIFDLPDLQRRMAVDGISLSTPQPEEDAALDRYRDKYRLGPRVGYPLLPFHPDGRLTGAAVVRVGPDGVRAVGFCPAVIDQSNEPIPAAARSAAGRRVIDYLRECCESQGLRTRVEEPRPYSGLPSGSIQVL